MKPHFQNQHFSVSPLGLSFPQRTVKNVKGGDRRVFFSLGEMAILFSDLTQLKVWFER